MDLEIGSNLYRNTNGTIEIEGVPLIEVSQHPSTGAVLLNFVLFDKAGKMLVKLSDSTMMFNERRAYEVAKTPKSLTLKESATGKVLVQFDVKAPNVLTLSQGEVPTIKGHLLEVSAKEWKLDKQRASGVTKDLNGGPVTIG